MYRPLPMTQKYCSYEIYDIAKAFITDKNVIFTPVLEDYTHTFYFQKVSDFGKYTLIIVAPKENTERKFGKIYFQENTNPPVLLTRTSGKVSAKPNKFEKLIALRYFELIDLIQKRQNNTLKLCDNYIAVMSAILNLKTL